MYARLDELVRHLWGDIDALGEVFARLRVSALRRQFLPAREVLLASSIPLYLSAALRWQRSTIEDDVRHDPMVSQEPYARHCVVHIPAPSEA